MGAGVATVMALKLKKAYPLVKCIAYSPPGGLISRDLATCTKSFVMSVIMGDDMVPRLSIHSIHSLKAEILKVIRCLRCIGVNPKGSETKIHLI